MTSQRRTFSLGRLETQSWYRWIVFAVSNLAFTFGVMFVSLGIIVPDIMRDFSIEARQAGLLISIYSYIYALMQIPGGALADRAGPRRVMSVFLAAGAGGMILFSQAATFSLALIARVLIALGVSVLYVNKVKVLRGWFKADQFATAMGLGSSVGSVGRLLAAPFLAALVGHFGWRTTYSAVGFFNLTFAVACWVFIRDRDPALTDEPDATEVATPTLPTPSVLEAISMCFGNWQFVALFFVALLSYGGLMGGTGAWGIPFLMQGYEMSRVNAALLMTSMGVLSLISGPVWGHVSDKRLRARKPVLLIGLFGLILTALPLATMAAKLTIPSIAIIMATRGLFTSALLLSYTMANELVPASIVGVAMACLNMGPYIGGGIYQALSGFILGTPASYAADGTPIYTVGAYQSVFMPAVLAGLVAVFITLLVRETIRREPSETTS